MKIIISQKQLNSIKEQSMMGWGMNLPPGVASDAARAMNPFDSTPKTTKRPCQKEKIPTDAEALLDLKTETVNTEIGRKVQPSRFREPHKSVGLTKDEIKNFIDLIDFPMDTSDKEKARKWILDGPDTATGGLIWRCVRIDGLWYPAVEQLRYKYNEDEYFETLASAAHKINMYKSLKDCYQAWIENVLQDQMPCDDPRYPR